MKWLPSPLNGLIKHILTAVCSSWWRTIAPLLGEMTSSRQYASQLHASGPRLASPAARRAILLPNKAGGACQGPVRGCDERRRAGDTDTQREGTPPGGQGDARKYAWGIPSHPRK